MPPSTSSGLYSKGTLVWIEDSTAVWRCCRLTKDYVHGSKELHVQDCDDDSKGEEIVVLKTVSNDKSGQVILPHLKNPDILIGSNDLTSLSYLHEPAVLFNLRVRFLDQRAIYTWCGIVLVAVNPFSDLDIYGDETIECYHESASSGSTQLDPHIYAVAEDAYSKLERESRNQSLIVSGESGAGKTVSAKFAMRYFASIASSSHPNEVSDLTVSQMMSSSMMNKSTSSGSSTLISSTIENRVLASNPIMESIGNAKTTRNDNSSRFGKYIQIMFDPTSRTKIVGGNMRTYLLEKSRVSFQNEGERNFHVFYQVCNWSRKNKLTEYMLYDNMGYGNFNYLGGTAPSDSDDCSKFIEAMTVLGFTERQQESILKIIAAILHSGNISFKTVNDEECTIPLDDQHLIVFCTLLGLDESSTRQWLTHRVLRTGMKEVIVTPVTKAVAESGRDALSKFIYEKMFSWVVQLINKALGVSSSSLTSTFIGVLDIYGFEHFETNSFEQFCINYANEVLQQQFNQHVFKLEQEEYVREGIDWTMITFTDNQPVIDLIEAKLGILSLLDEECKMPKGNDESWCSKLYAQLTVKFGENAAQTTSNNVQNNTAVFLKPKFGSRDSFIIQHFADKVTYSVSGFLDKNRDTVWEEQIDLLKRSTSLDGSTIFSLDSFKSEGPVVKSTGKQKISAGQAVGQQVSKQGKATVGCQFKDSLSQLMQILNSTTPHYVRCIKSNDDKTAFEFDNTRAVQQLRACGVLETIRISSNGFPTRWTYNDFSNRYRVLLVGVHRFARKKEGPPVPLPRKLIKTGSASTTEVRGVCEQIVKLVYELQVYSSFRLPFEKTGGTNEDGTPSVLPYQFGKSKIFFRAGQVALLERIRTARLRECAVLLQKTVRGWLLRRRYLKIRKSVLLLQKYGRGVLARRLVQDMRRNRAAVVIQSNWKMFIERKRFLLIKKTIVGLQSRGRGLLARRRFRNIQQESAAIVIQRYWRGWSARKTWNKKMRQIILVQSCIRRYFARKELKKLKIEARSVQHVQQLNKGLERKIIELQQKLNEVTHELRESRNKTTNMDDFKQHQLKMDTELKNLKNTIQDREKEIDKLKSEVEAKEKYNFSLEKKLQDNMNTIDALKEMNKKMEGSFDEKRVKSAVIEREKALVARFEQEKKVLIEELESEKYSRQQLLRKYAALEDQVAQMDSGVTSYEDGHDTSVTRSGGTDVSAVSLMMKCSEIEQESAKLKHENQQMRQLLAELSASESKDEASSLLVQQFASIQQELERTKEEKSHLKTIVLGQETSISKTGDSEVISAFKMIVKQLEREVDNEKLHAANLSSEISQLKKDMERQQELINMKINQVAVGSDSTNSDFVTRINQENLLLREKNDRLTDENKKLRVDAMRQRMLDNGSNNILDEDMLNESGKTYLGMFKYPTQKEQLLLDIIVVNLEPQVALKLTPHLTAYLLFMCVRYIDEVNDDVQVRSLLNSTVISMKKAVKRGMNTQNVEQVILWLANSVKFFILLKQFSGDEPFGVHEESLKNFDLSEYRQMFADLSIWMYQWIIKNEEERIQPLIVPAILEYEGLASSGIYSQPKQRSASISNQDMEDSTIEKPTDALIKELSFLHKVLLLHVVEPDLISQVFKQLFYFICSCSLNNLLLRKDLCHWNKAMQIRFNLSSLEQWYVFLLRYLNRSFHWLFAITK